VARLQALPLTYDRCCQASSRVVERCRRPSTDAARPALRSSSVAADLQPTPPGQLSGRRALPPTSHRRRQASSQVVPSGGPARVARSNEADRAPLFEIRVPARLIVAHGSGPGTPATPIGDRLRLLPSGPDLIRKPTPCGTRTIDAPSHGATGAEPLEGEFSPARADCGCRAPLPPRLARSALDHRGVQLPETTAHITRAFG
jgi:hypothetical protein